MSPDKGHPFFPVIDAKLANIVQEMPEKPKWFERWSGLSSESSEEERLAVYQGIRDSGVLPADAGFYLVSWQIDALTLGETDATLHALDERLEAIEADHNLGENEAWSPDDAPAEYKEVLERYHEAWDSLFADLLERFGEHEIAGLFRNDRPEYEKRSEGGRQFFLDSDPSAAELDAEWLDTLIEAVTGCIEPEEPMGPLGLRYSAEEGFWDVDIYPSPVELVGGADDGAVVAPNFSLDFERFRAIFDEVEDCGWNAFGWDDGLGPFVWFEGKFDGHPIFLRLLAHAPEGEVPLVKVRVPGNERRIVPGDED